MGTHSDDLRKIVADTTAEIDHYQSLLQKLLTKRDSAQLELDSIVYPVLTLPPEITAEIFVDCLPTSRTDCEWNAADPQEAPMLLSHVCRTWREIAIGTPALWTTMDLEIRDIESADIFKMWLSRTGALPLSVKLEISGDLEDDTTGGIFVTFAEHSRRMQSLELEISVYHLQDMDIADDQWCFPMLQLLNVCVFDAGDYNLRDDSGVPSIEIFRNSPLLCEVSLSVAPPSFFSFPWQQLPKFTSRLSTTADCLEMLRFSPSLTECSFEPFGIAEDLTEVTHRSLQSLTLFETPLSGRDSICGLDILLSLTLPALHTLQILDFKLLEDDDWDIFISFLYRSSPLQKFTLRLDDATEFDTIILLSMPKLVDLEIWNPTTAFITNLCHQFDLSDPSFLPQLQHLAFLGCEGSMPEVRDMLELLQPGLACRWHARHRPEFAELESFCAVWTSDISNLDDGALLPFRKLAAEGLDIRIQGTSIS
ncbi:hypothetical protein FB451DRAFT_1562674 [Mycena latifolia]|nr:hypothetical protein FB451DRAFT_1562674 [Mycena latifolia]